MCVVCSVECASRPPTPRHDRQTETRARECVEQRRRVGRPSLLAHHPTLSTLSLHSPHRRRVALAAAAPRAHASCDRLTRRRQRAAAAWAAAVVPRGGWGKQGGEDEGLNVVFPSSRGLGRWLVAGGGVEGAVGVGRVPDEPLPAVGAVQVGDHGRRRRGCGGLGVGGMEEGLMGGEGRGSVVRKKTRAALGRRARWGGVQKTLSLRLPPSFFDSRRTFWRVVKSVICGVVPALGRVGGCCVFLRQ